MLKLSWKALTEGGIEAFRAAVAEAEADSAALRTQLVEALASVKAARSVTQTQAEQHRVAWPYPTQQPSQLDLSPALRETTSRVLRQ